MTANAQVTTDALLPVLNIPKEGRLLSFGAGGALVSLEIAAQRPDILVVLCDTSYETTRMVSDRSLAEKLDNIIVGDTPAGPLVDRALIFEAFAALQDLELVTIRNSMLPGGYAIFADSGAPGDAMAAKLTAFGYKVADVLDSIDDLHIVRAR
jgi:hypothetical protein